MSAKLLGPKLALNRFAKIKKDETGATAIEYGLIVSLIALALFVGLRNYYTSLGSIYSAIEAATNDLST